MKLLDKLKRKGLISDYSLLDINHSSFPILVVFIELNNRKYYISIEKFSNDLLNDELLLETIIANKVIDTIKKVLRGD